MATKQLKYPLINGVGYTFASLAGAGGLTISCDFTGQVWKPKGFSAITYKTTRDRGEPAYGPHPDPLYKGRGQNKHEASLTLYLPDENYLRSVVLGGVGWRDRMFNLSLKFFNEGLDLVSVDIRGCTWDVHGVDAKKGTELLTVESPLSPLKIIVNGEDDTDDPLVTAAA